MNPSNRNNRSDFGALSGWYGHRRDLPGRFVFAVIGNIVAAYDGESLFIRIGQAREAHP